MFDVRTAPIIPKVSGFSHRGGERRTRQRLSTEVQPALETSSSWLFLSSRLRYLYRGASSYTTQLKTALNGKVDGDEQNEQVGCHEAIFCLSIRSFLLEENTFDCLQDLLECSNYDPWLVSLTTFVQVECYSLVEANRSYFTRVWSSNVSVCLFRKNWNVLFRKPRVEQVWTRTERLPRRPTRLQRQRQVQTNVLDQRSLSTSRPRTTNRRARRIVVVATSVIERKNVLLACPLFFLALRTKNSLLYLCISSIRRRKPT